DEGSLFQLRVDADPALLGRAFLVYELTGLASFAAVPRRINGFPVQGGFNPELGAAAGLQVEEISPEWLFKGDNEIRFLPAAAGDPVGYRVRRLRVVGIPGAQPALAAAGRAPVEI